MPKIDVSKLNGEARVLAERIVKGDGSLRASKPKVVKGNAESGAAAYVWRMVAYLISPNPRHQCMPVTADWDIQVDLVASELRYQKRRDEAKRLDAIVDLIVDMVPPTEWHGVRRWGQAFGVVGGPVVRQGGTIVYR